MAVDIAMKLIRSMQSKVKKPRTRQQRAKDLTSEILSMAEASAHKPSNDAADIIGAEKLGGVLLEALRKKAHAAEPEPVDDPGPGLRGRVRNKKRPDSGKVIAVKMVVIDGVEVECKVLDPGGIYHVGKSAPSGRPPGGTNRRAGADPVEESDKKLHHYLERRAESAAKFEEANPGATMKGGIKAQDIDKSLDALRQEALEHGVDLEDLA